MDNAFALLRLLQLCNSSLPVGAYSYSEGLETLCEQNIITSDRDLKNWLQVELQHGSVAIELAVMIRAYRAWVGEEIEAVRYWNDWYSASRETEELRSQSLQMGRSLLKLVQDLAPPLNLETLDPRVCNYCIAFGIAASHWQIELQHATLGYVQSWVVNWVNAGVKLIPLGQTQGQRMLVELAEEIIQCVDRVIAWADEEIEGNNWGLQLASMTHETLYSRIFRS